MSQEITTNAFKNIYLPSIKYVAVGLTRFQKPIENKIFIGYQQDLLQLYRTMIRISLWIIGTQNASGCGRTTDDNVLNGCSVGASLVPICWLLPVLRSPLPVLGSAMNSWRRI